MSTFGRSVHRLIVAASVSLCCGSFAQADDEGPPARWRSAVEAVVMPDITRILSEPIVEYTVLAQNANYADLDQSDIDALDAQWRDEREQNDQPLISAVLSNPTSSYLTRVQALSIGLFSEIFVMDHNGLNVGHARQSAPRTRTIQRPGTQSLWCLVHNS